MAQPVLIIGGSGKGKSASLRNFKDNDIFLINVLGKSLPFRDALKLKLTTDDYGTIRAKMLAATQNGINTIVIDDSGYLITNKFMKNQGTKKGNAVFEFYSQLAFDFWDLIEFTKSQLPNNVVVYFIMHEDVDDVGNVKPKTIGRMLNEKVCVEGMFTIVLSAIKNEKKYLFRTQSNGLDIAKTPIGLFDDEEIDNDLAMVNSKIREYYNMEEKTNA